MASHRFLVIPELVETIPISPCERCQPCQIECAPPPPANCIHEVEKENYDYQGSEYDDSQRSCPSKKECATSCQAAQAKQRIHKKTLSHRLLKRCRCLSGIFCRVIANEPQDADPEVPAGKDYSNGWPYDLLDHAVPVSREGRMHSVPARRVAPASLATQSYVKLSSNRRSKAAWI